MAKVEIEIPEITGRIEIPRIKEGAASGDKFRSYPCKEKDMAILGFPTQRVEDWRQKAIAKMGELLKKYKSLQVYLDTCVRCGSCADKCQFFLGTKDPKNMPVARQELLRKVYRRYFTPAGKMLGKLANAEDLTEDVLNEWYVYFYQCSQCRRCSVYCPYGIDTAEICMAAREIMDAIGVGQKYTTEVLGKVLTIGNNLGLQPNALKNTLEFVEEEIKEATGVDVRLPMDEEGAEILLVTPSADFFASPHIESLIGYAKVFHQAGISWTISSHAAEFGNFGMFIGNYSIMQKVSQRIADAVRNLKVKRLIVGECGHAWRVAYSFWNTLVGPFDTLDPKYPGPQHICEFTMDLINRGVLKIDKSANDEFSVTFHDSCNVARASRMGNCAGGQFEIPRALIKAVCNKYVDMAEETIKENTFCCGAGAGLLTDELMQVRVAGVMPRMQALKQVVDSHGVNFFALICAVCKAQFTAVFPKYGLPMEMVGGVHQLVSKAIQI
ncbi:(Fe-S)-binding protein [bacterium]|nr:(Fe-S)-binding protein [bacterium]MBU1152762.1 (Fe-S)-binding protein [bacterium]MBU2600516.1 (Fe-S)-binding protein [bacterium]